MQLKLSMISLAGAMCLAALATEAAASSGATTEGGVPIDPTTGEPVQGWTPPAEEPRNELHDSYDAFTGTITAEAAELRAEHGILAAGEQIPDTAPEADAG